MNATATPPKRVLNKVMNALNILTFDKFNIKYAILDITCLFHVSLQATKKVKEEDEQLTLFTQFEKQCIKQ